MYRTRQIRIRKKNPLRDYCAALCLGSAALYNRANFLIRQYATACRDLEEGKPLTGNQSEAFRMITEVTRGTRYEPKGRWLGYGQLDYILKRTEDPAYRALPAQANQQILKGLLRNYKSFFAALKAYGLHPERFTGRPRMPGYKKKGTESTAILTNQICRIRGERHIRFPGTKEMLDMGPAPEGGRLKEVRIRPCHDSYTVEAVLEYPDSILKKGKLSGMDEAAIRNALEGSGEGDFRIAAIDPGVRNFCAVANNFGARPFLIRGGAIKSANQYYNKELAWLKSEAEKCNRKHITKRIRHLTARRSRILKDLMHKASRKIAEWAEEQGVDLVVLGHNVFQKQEISLGHVNNQVFVQIPYCVFADMLRYKLEEKGIAFLSIEESYTSKADFLAGDEIPVYGKREGEEKKEIPVFSGKRISRSWYRHFDGTKSNADINGAANILRKVIPNRKEWDRGVVDTPYAVRIA